MFLGFKTGGQRPPLQNLLRPVILKSPARSGTTKDLHLHGFTQTIKLQILLSGLRDQDDSADKPLTISVAQLGARMHYAVPRILHGAGMLEGFYTDLAAVRGWPALLRALGTVSGANSVLGRMNERVPGGVPPGKITHWPAFAIEYYVRQRRATTPAELRAAYLWAGTEFCRRIIRHGLGKANAVYTFNSAGLELLEHARECSLLGVMEQTSSPCAVEGRLMEEEYSLWPDWEVPRPVGPCRAAFSARERAEWECASLIVCGSEFVRRGIAECGGPAGRCAVVPYGVDLPHSAPTGGSCRAPSEAGSSAPPRRERHKDKLRVLVAAGVRLQKGAPYILQASAATERLAEFRWCGGVSLVPQAAARLQERVKLMGAVPRPQMAEHYAWADLFLLPSICEGSATVCYEALAAGLPVITTENAGSVVRDGIDGFIVPIRDPGAIAERLENLHRDRARLESMSCAALERAREFTVERYGERLIAVLATARGGATP